MPTSDAQKAANRRYYLKNKAKIKARVVEYYKQHPDRLKAAVMKWRDAHTTEYNEYTNNYNKKRRVADPAYAKTMDDRSKASMVKRFANMPKEEIKQLRKEQSAKKKEQLKADWLAGKLPRLVKEVA